MAYKVDQCKQHSDKLAVELDAEWCDEFEGEFGRLIDEVKIRVPLCLCGAFFVHETSPIDFRCRHCFKLYDTDGVVIHYCQQQRDCAHFNSDYYLCNDCAMSLRKSHWAEGIGDRASSRLMNSIGIIGAAVESATVAAVDEWKDVSVRVYFYEQQLERLRTHLCSEEGTQLASKLEETLHQMKQHLATCLCGNLFVSGPSPIDYECRSCFDECRVEENIYVCKSKQKCQHWRNHYYICDDCSILLRKSSKFDSESLRIVDRLDGAISFIRDEFTGAIQSQLLLQPQNKDLSIFNKYLHKASSFYSNFLSQIASHITAIQLEETLLCYRALKSYILKTSNKFVDEKYRNKLKSEMIMFGFIRELYLSLDIDCVIHSAVPEYVFHVCLDYYFQIHPQMIVIAASNAIQCADFNDGSSSNLSFYDIKSFNKSIFKKKRSCCTIRCATPSISIKKDSPFTMAINISIPSFIRSIKPSLFDENHHYDVVFNPHQALIIDSCNFNHHYSDHYAFKSRSILSTKRHQTHRRQQNGYSLSLPAALRNTSSVLFDYGRAQLLAYSNHSLYWLPFNEAIHSENEWKWTRLSQQQMKWSRHAPSLAMCGDEDNQLFIVGDVQMNHAKYTEMYCFARQEWMQCAHCPYAAECLYNDDVDDRMFYLGGNQRNAGYYDAHKDEWCKIPSTTYVYKKHNSVIWNELRHASQQVLWAANTNQCEFLDLRQDERQWQTFPNLDNNNTHHKLHNLINKRFDPAATNDNSAASDYTLLCRI